MLPIFHTDHGPLTFSASYPAGWEGNRLPGASPMSYVGRLGTVLVQELKLEHCLVRFSSFHFFQSINLFCKSEERLQSLFSIKGNVTYQLDQLPPFDLADGQFIMLKARARNVVTTFPAGRECHLWHAYYSLPFYRQWHGLFPALKGQKGDKPLLFTLQPQPANTAAIAALQASFHTPYNTEVQLAYNELKIRESLFTFLALCGVGTDGYSLTAREKRIAQLVHDIIMKDIRVHYTNQELAQKAVLNVADLKRIFKRQYGVGMFGLLQRERFAKASALLLAGELSIKEIAAQIGYPHTTSFITEFRKYYGYTPLDVQKGNLR